MACRRVGFLVKSMRWIAWLPILFFMLILRLTCRARLVGDPRPELRRSGQTYVYAVLHAHQLSAAAASDDPGTMVMVSRSADGDMVQAGLYALGLRTVRGSSRLGMVDKGGRQALQGLTEHVRQGRPAFLTVDGPRGPRNRVRKGIAVLSRQTGATVLPVVAIPRRRWILQRSWDRYQIPQPFTRIDIHFAPPLRPHDGESTERFRRRIEAALRALESDHDPPEAAQCRRSTN